MIDKSQTVAIPPQDVADLRDMIAVARSVCLLGHTSPDGDAVGSTTGFARCLRRAFPHLSVWVILPNPFPRVLQNTPGVEEVLIHSIDPKAVENAIQEADLICCMDFQEAKRVGPKLAPLLAASDAPKVLIDHHLHPDESFFALSFSYPPLSSTAELACHLIEGMRISEYVDADVATSLLTGVITDTGCFAYSSESPTVFEITAKLIRCGARKVDIINDNFHSMRIGQFRLRGYALGEKLHILPEIHTAYFTLSAEELERYDAQGSDTEGFVNAPLDIDGIHYCFFAREQGEEIKISFRSVGDYAVNNLAHELFGGGGHKNAAGAECPRSMGLEGVSSKILHALEQRQRQSQS